MLTSSMFLLIPRAKHIAKWPLKMCDTILSTNAVQMEAIEEILNPPMTLDNVLLRLLPLLSGNLLYRFILFIAATKVSKQ